MPDLNDDDLFAGFKDEGTPVNPLPASEVRRRGDRMRRRNNTLAAVGGVAAALVVIATPLAVVANQDSDQSVDPPIATRSTEVAWLQEIPVDVDVSLGIQGADASQDPEPGEDAAVTAIDVCGDRVFASDDGPVDLAGAHYSQELSGNQTNRTLALYPDAATATAVTRTIISAVEECGTTDAGTAGDQVTWQVTTGQLAADQSFVVTRAFTAAGEDVPYETVFHVVARTGNAVLVTEHGVTALQGDEQQAEQEAVADVVDQLQVFGEAADRVPTTDGAADLDGTVPDGFDLLAGFPEQSSATGSTVGREGPDRGLDLAPYGTLVEACGRTPAGLPTPTDTLYAGWRDPSQGLLRQLMAFDSAADAQAYADAVLAVYDDCSEDIDASGVTKVYERSDAPVGDQAATVVLRHEVDGEPGPGHQVVQVVRVGSSVLLFVANADGADPVDPTTGAADLTATYLGTNQPVISAM